MSRAIPKKLRASAQPQKSGALPLMFDFEDLAEWMHPSTKQFFAKHAGSIRLNMTLLQQLSVFYLEKKESMELLRNGMIPSTVMQLTQKSSQTIMAHLMHGQRLILDCFQNVIFVENGGSVTLEVLIATTTGVSPNGVQRYSLCVESYILLSSTVHLI